MNDHKIKKFDKGFQYFVGALMGDEYNHEDLSEHCEADSWWGTR